MVHANNEIILSAVSGKIFGGNFAVDGVLNSGLSWSLPFLQLRTRTEGLLNCKYARDSQTAQDVHIVSAVSVVVVLGLAPVQVQEHGARRL